MPPYNTESNAVDITDLQNELTEHFEGTSPDGAERPAHDSSSSPSVTAGGEAHTPPAPSFAEEETTGEKAPATKTPVAEDKVAETAPKALTEEEQRASMEAFVRANPQAGLAIQFGQMLSQLPQEAQNQIVQIIQQGGAPAQAQKKEETDPYAKHKEILEEMEVTFPGVSNIFGAIIQQNQALEQRLSQIQGDVDGRRAFEENYKVEALKNNFLSQEAKLRSEIEPVFGAITPGDIEQIKIIAIGERQAHVLRGDHGFVPDVYEIGKKYFDQMKLYNERMQKRNLINGTQQEKKMPTATHQETRPAPTNNYTSGSEPYESPVDAEMRRQFSEIEKRYGEGSI